VAVTELILGPIVKKLTDLLGDAALGLTKKDRARAGAYDAYRALRRIEKHLEVWERLLPQIGTFPAGSQEALDLLRSIKEELDGWISALQDLERSYRQFDTKLEIFSSMQPARFLDSAAQAEDLYISYARTHRDTPPSRRTTDHIVITVRKCREIVAEYIRSNYKIDQREDGL
jgi:hypothetical protein